MCWYIAHNVGCDCDFDRIRVYNCVKVIPQLRHENDDFDIDMKTMMKASFNLKFGTRALYIL
jgi:hypothetical protein